MELDYVYVAPTNHVSILLVWLVFSRIILFFLYFETLVFNRVSRLGSEPWSSSELPSPSFISNTILFHTDEAEVLSAYRCSTKDPVSRTGSLGVGTNLHRGWEKNQVLFLLRGDVSQHCVITGFDGKHIVDLQHTHRDSLVITIRNLVTITMKTARCCRVYIYMQCRCICGSFLSGKDPSHRRKESCGKCELWVKKNQRDRLSTLRGT